MIRIPENWEKTDVQETEVLTSNSQLLVSCLRKSLGPIKLWWVGLMKTKHTVGYELMNE